MSFTAINSTASQLVLLVVCNNLIVIVIASTFSILCTSNLIVIVLATGSTSAYSYSYYRSCMLYLYISRSLVLVARCALYIIYYIYGVYYYM